MVWRCACGLDVILALILSLFPLCHFLTSDSMKVLWEWVPCERNSSYNLKLCTCFLHGLKICMWFGCNPCIYFYNFFPFTNFVIFWPQILWKCCDSGDLVSAALHTILYRSFYAPPPESGGVLCYTLRNFECPSVCLSVRPSVSAHHHSCISNSSYSFRPILLKLDRCFKDGLKICILFFQNPEIIFYHFFSHF